VTKFWSRVTFAHLGILWKLHGASIQTCTTLRTVSGFLPATEDDGRRPAFPKFFVETSDG